MVTNDYGLRSSVTAMLTQLGWSTLEQRRENQRLTMMYKVVHGLVAVPTTQLIPADSRTKSNHNFKFRNIGSNSTPVTMQILVLPTNNSYLESPPSHDRRSHVSRCVQASASIAPPHWITSIGVISLPYESFQIIYQNQNPKITAWEPRPSMTG